ncbi:MAG: CPBP family intramembrane metalloprotease [Pseudomonadales bacterium]|nr:CPBP family intramembrane metalloprotease [Pseudomonadales bacterium]MBO6566628.1 CPBP family intramembrane metalloprotease [Pseudomonadales bacterium]MBO6597038.1 CPBP family intramembrane metalloprotease [Pseudomonadales bacterium]MBO6823775.1 CPBP family intramembrane metalloprotease [Pseudomonadales bacterium]
MKTLGWLECLFIALLIPVGAVAGAQTGIVVLGPVFAVCIPLAVASAFLRLRGERWRQLNLFQRLPWKETIGWTIGAIVSALVLSNIVVTPLLKQLGVPPTNVSALVSLIEGDLTYYLLFLFPVAWGSAAVGEELLVRGYLLYRMETLSNTWIAVILQALIFSLAHLYQGWMGVINIFVLALVFGIVFVRSGRSLWPLIVAHGLIDTVAITLIYIGRSDLLIGAS